MATKTISIDTEAYARLKGVQKENESFSQVIKRVVWQPEAFLEMLKRMEEDPLSDEAAEAIEKVVAQRRGATRSTSRRKR